MPPLQEQLGHGVALCAYRLLDSAHPLAAMGRPLAFFGIEPPAGGAPEAEGEVGSAPSAAVLVGRFAIQVPQA